MNESVKTLLSTVLEAVQPMRECLTKFDQEIEQREAELKELRTARQQAKKVLDLIDPQAPKPRRRQNGDGPSKVPTDAQVARIFPELPNRIFTAQEAAEAVGIHVTTIHKVLKVLHDRGQVRVDHLGGQRNTTKFYALTGETDV